MRVTNVRGLRAGEPDVLSVVELRVPREQFNLVRAYLAEIATRQSLVEASTEPTVRAMTALSRASELSAAHCFSLVMRGNITGLVNNILHELPPAYDVPTQTAGSWHEFRKMASNPTAMAFQRYVDLTPQDYDHGPSIMPSNAEILDLDYYGRTLDEPGDEFYELLYERSKLRPPRQEDPGLYGHDARPTINIQTATGYI